MSLDVELAKKLEDALVRLRRNPSNPVRVRIEELDIELRVVAEDGEPEGWQQVATKKTPPRDTDEGG